MQSGRALALALAQRSAILLGSLLLAGQFASLTGCTLPALRRAPSHGEAMRVSQLSDVGDPARQASLRLVVDGLDADAAQSRDRALSMYEQAIRIDATNPYAYLAIARHHAESNEPEWALSFLDRADSLLRSQGGVPPRVEPHIVGLRGQALYASGHIDEGLPLLEEAWDLAPDVWGDGQLSASELR